jgi:hypothetical protein
MIFLADYGASMCRFKNLPFKKGKLLGGKLGEVSLVFTTLGMFNISCIGGV